MVPGAYSPLKFTGGALDRAHPPPPPLKKLGPPPMMSRIIRLGLRLAGRRQHRHRRKQQSQNPGSFSPRENIKSTGRDSHNCRCFASKQARERDIFERAVKKATRRRR